MGLGFKGFQSSPFLFEWTDPFFTKLEQIYLFIVLQKPNYDCFSNSTKQFLFFFYKKFLLTLIFIYL